MEDKIVSLFGDPIITEEEASSEKILNKAVGANWERVLVIGQDQGVVSGFITNLDGKADAVYIMEQLKMLLLTGGFEK